MKRMKNRWLAVKPAQAVRWARLAEIYSRSSDATRAKLAKRVKIPVSDLDQLLQLLAIERNGSATQTHAARLGRTWVNSS